MNQSQFSYNPDEWAHDLDQWWTPLVGLAAEPDCTALAWLNVLGVEEFFDRRLLEQSRLLTPWICLVATAVAANAARSWAETAARQDADTTVGDAWLLATAAFDLALSLEEFRWSGGNIGDGPIGTRQLIDMGRTTLISRGHAVGGREPTPVYLAAGWAAHSCGADRLRIRPAERPPALGPSGRSAAECPVASVAKAAASSSPIAWGTAHLAERLLDGALDRRRARLRPDELPAEARANVLLAAGRGEVGLLEARRHASPLEVPSGTVVPDLARMAFVHGTADFLESITTAFAAARKAERLDRPGELISWNIQLPGGTHPLAERSVSGRSAGLGAYVAFRALSSPGVFADKDVAFTGQVSADGQVGQVQRASDKIGAAQHRRIRLVVHPKGQTWQDPYFAVQLEGVETGEDAVIAAAPQLRGLRSYLEAACHLVAPEPWLKTWLQNQGRREEDLPLLDVVCRHLSPAREALPADAVRTEPEISSCLVHLLPSLYPDCSFIVSADAGGGNTTAAKRMVAEAARRALDALRVLGDEERAAGFILPLYLPLGDPPASWDNLVQASVAALPALDGLGLDTAVAVANALRADAPHRWQCLLVVDGTDRIRREGGAPSGKEQELAALITGKPYPGHSGWQPYRPTQVVLCGRAGNPTHHRAAAALRRERPGSTATMSLDPLGAREIDRYVSSLSKAPVFPAGKARDLATNPLFLTFSVIAGRPNAGDGGSTDLLDRVIDVLLGQHSADRRFLAEIAFRAAAAKGEPVGEFTLADISTQASSTAVNDALAQDDTELAMALALDRDERRSFHSAEEDTNLVTASGGGWRFFHDRAFAFLVADRIAWHAIADSGSDDDLFGQLGAYLGDPLWTDVIEAVGRLLELRGREPA